MSDLDPELALAIDEDTLYALLVRYARGLDRWDAELVLSVFHPDAVLYCGGYSGSAVELHRAILDGARQPIGGQHVITNALFDVRGDSADGECYFVARRAGVGNRRIAGEVDAQPPGPSFPIERVGRFVDRYERRDGAWRVATRRVVLEWLPEQSNHPLLGPLSLDLTFGTHPEPAPARPLQTPLI
jgi:hypothetical protein